MHRKEDELKKLIEDLYSQIKEGVSPETISIELKREWYNLSNAVNGDAYKMNVSKFIKEIGALANGYGPWSGNIIIGLSEDGIISDSPLSRSGLKDESDLYSLVVKCIDKPIRFEFYQIRTDIDGLEKTVSIIVVPVSIDKPHVMYEYITDRGHRYENYIPVKKGTSVRSATRSDLDLMYYDKQNIVPEYALNIRTYNGSAIDIKKAGASVSLDMPVIFENYGRKPMILIKAELVISESDGIVLPKKMTLSLGAYSLASLINTRREINQQPIIIPSNEAQAYTCHFYSSEVIDYEIIRSGKIVGQFIAKDAFENSYESTQWRSGN